MDGFHDNGQVCLNGHIITTNAFTCPEETQEYCIICGEKTITNCPICTQSIKGTFYGDCYTEEPRHFPPSYCQHCGKPFNWTIERLRAAREIAFEIDTLTPEEKERLVKSLDDLVKDTPQTQLAITRFKKYVPKAGIEVAQAFKAILIDIVSESVKKSIWP